MAHQYWVKSGDNVAGPFSGAQIKQIASAGGIMAGDLISGDQAKWTPAEKVKGLLPAAGPAPAAPAQPAAPPPAAAPAAAPAPAPAPAAPAEPEADPRFARTRPDMTVKQPGQGGLKKPLIIGAIAVVVIGAGVFGYMEFFTGTDVGEILEFAPPDAFGVTHIDVRELAEDVLGQLEKEKQEIPPEIIKPIRKFIDKVESIDIFMLGSVPGPPFVVLRGSLTKDDVSDLAGAMGKGRELPLEKVRSGVYDCNAGGTPVRIIFGGEASEAPKGVVLIGMQKMMTDKFVKNLGSGDHEALRDLLASIDDPGPVLIAAKRPEGLKDKDVPKSAVGSFDPGVGGHVRLIIECTSKDGVTELKEAFDSPGNPIAKYVKLSVDGTRVTFEGELADGAVAPLVAAIIRARTLARRVMSASNLNAIGKGILIYDVEHNGGAPEHLGLLVVERSISLTHLISPHGNTPKVGWDPAAGKIPTDYVYMHLPVDADADLIMAYERPELNKGEGTNVMYPDTHVEWLEMPEFRKQLKKTQDWLAKNPR